jgi:uncharacterized membrane protein YccC
MSDNLRNALITGAACLIGTLLAFLLCLQNPYWATMTAWATTALPGRQLGAPRAFLQVFATAVGCFVGYQVSVHTEARPILQFLGLFLFAGVGTYMRFRSRFFYAWGLGSFSAIMLAAMTLYRPSILYTDAFYRGYEIVCGVAGVLIAQVPLAWILDRAFPRPPGPIEPPPSTKLDRRDAAQIGIVGGLTVSLTPVIWTAFHLPIGSLLITMIAPLVALDVVFISRPIRTHWRLFGSFMGGVFGILATALAADSFAVWSLFLFAGLAACAYIRGARRPWSISGMQFGLSFMFAQVTGSGPSADMSVVIDRLAGLVIGLLVMIVVAYYVRLFFQDRPVEQMAERLHPA